MTLVGQDRHPDPPGPPPAAQGLIARRPRSAGLRGWTRYARAVFLIPALAYVLFAFALPIVYNLILSFEQTSPATIVQPVRPVRRAVANYKTVLLVPTTQSAIVRTFTFTALSLFFQFVIGFGLALLFNLRFPLRRVARSLVIIPWLLPLLITGFIFKFLFQLEAGRGQPGAHRPAPDQPAGRLADLARAGLRRRS